MFSTAVYATEIPMDIAVLRGLDKVTGRMSTFSIPVGEVGQFGKTFVVPEACYTRPPEEFPENSAFLYVFEKSLKGENIEMFKGWSILFMIFGLLDVKKMKIKSSLKQHQMLKMLQKNNLKKMLFYLRMKLFLFKKERHLFHLLLKWKSCKLYH